MSTLSINQRPTVAFDPSNKQHREWYVEFSKNRSWSKCPVKFEVKDDDTNNLAYTMQRMLVAYYLGKEFKAQIALDLI